MAKRQRQRRQVRRRRHAKREGWRTRHSVITGASLAAGATLAMAPPALGAPLHLTVNSSLDNGDGDCQDVVAGDCTLRDAINDANANSGQYDYIHFDASISGSVLTAGQIPITDSVGLYGNGPGATTITASSSARIFDVDPADSGDVVLFEDLTLTGGNVTGDGGAIRNDDAILTVRRSVLTGNTASGKGGAIYEPGNFEHGLYNYFGYSTFSNNHADYGGGIYAYYAAGYLTNDTFDENTATSTASGMGGGLNAGLAGLYDSTISGNHAAASGGGAYFYNVNVFGTILANNTAASNPDLDIGGIYSYAGVDLIKSPGTLVFGSSVITGQDPQLGTLGDNGGPTPTLKPAATSPVVDQSYSYAYYDQRLLDRTVDNPNRNNITGGNGADIGSVELTLAEGPQATPPAPAPTPVPHKKKKCKKKKKHRSGEAAKKKKCKKKKRRFAAAARVRIDGPAGPSTDPRATRRARATAGLRWPDAAHHRAFTLRGR
jgi:predicted outer membrane repeat protein